jgi:hypothetical protein
MSVDAPHHLATLFNTIESDLFKMSYATWIRFPRQSIPLTQT